MKTTIIIQELYQDMQEILKEYGVTCYRGIMINEVIKKFEPKLKKHLSKHTK